LTNRRRALENLVDRSDVLPVRRLSDDGLEAWAVVQARGYEGLIAKDPRESEGPGGGDLASPPSEGYLDDALTAIWRGEALEVTQ
jgi:hypothetical protein